MAMLTESEFTARLEAALALKKEREMRAERNGVGHLKDKTSKGSLEKQERKMKKMKDKKREEEGRVSKRKMRQNQRNGNVPMGASTTSSSNENVEEPLQQEQQEQQEDYTEEMDQDEEPPEIDPKQSLFDNHISSTVQENSTYMYNKYGFFIPDREYLIDLEGLIGYCQEKVKLGHTCLYCQKQFKTWSGLQKHMISTGHTKLRYEADVDLDEFDPFYDFTAADVEFLESGIGNHKIKAKNKQKKKVQVDGDGNEDMEIVQEAEQVELEEEDDDDSAEWEDVTDDEDDDGIQAEGNEDDDEDMDEEEDGLYAAYQDEISKHGFDITPLGELIFPDGRIIGHRGLSRYYKQRFAPEQSNATAVNAARIANGEVVYEGRVYNRYGNGRGEQKPSKEDSLALAKAGLSIGAVQGRAGKGILVPTGNSRSSFTALSLYRYRAVVNKSRRLEKQGQRLQHRTTLPMNKMDKKANRLFNNVSVAHAKR